MFEGRALSQTTEHEYDGAGILIRSVTVNDPVWTSDDQAVAVALQQYRDSLCDCCGLPKSMTLVNERDAPRFVVGKKYCLARKTLIESQTSYTNNGKDQKPTHAALQWSVRAEK